MAAKWYGAAVLTSGQQIIVDLLGEAPRAMRELASACGYGPDDRGGHSYVSVQLGRLADRGYVFHNGRPPGSHRGGFYVLVARPHRQARGVRRCESCGAFLASDHPEDCFCSPCQRSALTAELETACSMTCRP